MMRLALTKIRTDGGTQTRAAINDATVESYVEALSAGATFPPMVVFYDGADHWLADGFHREAAYRKVDLDDKLGTVDPATLVKVSTPQEREAMETQLRQLAEWAALVDAELSGDGYVTARRDPVPTTPRAAHRRRAREVRTAPPPPVDGLSYDQQRSRRKRAVRSATVARRKLSKLLRKKTEPRHLPLTRAGCPPEGACPYVSCSHHLFLDVNEYGGIKFNFPDLIDEDDNIDLATLPFGGCSLRAAADGGVSLERVAEAVNVVRERARQIEREALENMRRNGVDLLDLLVRDEVRDG